MESKGIGADRFTATSGKFGALITIDCIIMALFSDESFSLVDSGIKGNGLLTIAPIPQTIKDSAF
jgi:hypothetical protein